MSGTVSEATTTLSSSLSTNNISMILLLLGIVGLGVYVFFELRKMNRRIDEVERSTPNTTTTTMDAYPQVIVDPMHSMSSPTQNMGHVIQQMPQQAQASGVRPSTPYPTSEVRQESRVAPENAISEIDALMTKDITEMKAMIEPQPSVTKSGSVGVVFPTETIIPDDLLNVPFPDISDLAPGGSEEVPMDPFQSSVQEQPDQTEDHSKKSVSELKEILLKWGLATSGNKKKLIQRINEHTGVKADVVKANVVKETSGPTTTDVLSSLDVTVTPIEPVASSEIAELTEGSKDNLLSLP